MVEVITFDAHYGIDPSRRSEPAAGSTASRPGYRCGRAILDRQTSSTSMTSGAIQSTNFRRPGFRSHGFERYLAVPLLREGIADWSD